MSENRKILFFAGILFSVAAEAALATNGNQLSAIGAYQQGLGGAVTAAPYDATTAISNPAGMALIGNRTDFTIEAFFLKRRESFSGGGTTTGGSGLYPAPSVGWTAPVNDRQDLFFGGGLYSVSGLGVDYDVVKAPLNLETSPVAGGLGWTPGSAKGHIYSQYQFWKMAPTLAWKSGGFAVGFALNLDYQIFGFKNLFTGTLGGAAARYGMDLSATEGALGYGATVGFLYQPSPAFGMGLSYASRQFFSDFTWRLAAGDVSNVPDVNQTRVSSKDGIYTMNLDFPQQAAIGIAVRPARTFLWTVDVKWINYSDTYKTATLKGDFTNNGTAVPLAFGWQDVFVYATGLQFDLTPNFALRLGYNHSNAPIKAKDVENNLALPAIVQDHASGGFTYRFGRHWETSMAYLKAFQNSLTGASQTKISLEEDAGDFEISYRF